MSQEEWLSCYARMCGKGISDRKTFRKWALKGHPDLGGDQEEYKNVTSCFDVLPTEWDCKAYQDDSGQAYYRQLYGLPPPASAGIPAAAAAHAAAAGAGFGEPAAAAASSSTAGPSGAASGHTFLNEHDFKRVSDLFVTREYVPYNVFRERLQKQNNIEISTIAELYREGKETQAREFSNQIQLRDQKQKRDALNYFNSLGLKWPESLISQWPPKMKPRSDDRGNSAIFFFDAQEYRWIDNDLTLLLPPQFASSQAKINFLNTVLWGRTQDHRWAENIYFQRTPELWLSFYLNPQMWTSIKRWRAFQNLSFRDVDFEYLENRLAVDFPEVNAIRNQDLQAAENERKRIQALQDEELKERLRSYERDRIRAERRAANRRSDKSPTRSSAGAAAAARSRSRSPRREETSNIVERDRGGLSRADALNLLELASHTPKYAGHKWILKMGSKGYWYFYRHDNPKASFFAQELL